MATMTYREIIREIIPTHAIAEAERRVYDRPSYVWYFSDDGYCALGAMCTAMHPGKRYTLANPRDLLPRGHGHRFRRASLVLGRIVKANDAGQLATPGSLTTLLDREMRAVIH